MIYVNEWQCDDCMYHNTNTRDAQTHSYLTGHPLTYNDSPPLRFTYDSESLKALSNRLKGIEEDA